MLSVAHGKKTKTQPFLSFKAASCVSKVTGTNQTTYIQKIVETSTCADPTLASFINFIKWDLKILSNKHLLLLY